MTNIVSVNNVYFKYNGKTILNGINLEVNDKEIVAILGPNGSGKTTLVKIIVGILKPLKGEVHLKVSPREISYVPQDFNVNNPVITVEEFFKSTCNKFSSDILNTFNIKNILNKRLSEISYGELRKVLICASFLRNPKLLIMDEPTNGLDANSKETFYKKLHEYVKEGASCIIVSHDLEHILRVASKIYYLKRGNLVPVKKHD